MKEKIRNVDVVSNKDYVMWQIDIENAVRDTTLNVAAGCIALYIVNGMLKSTNMPGRWCIKSKDEERSNARLQLIGVNTDRTFEIRCGVGDIPFKDYELNVETKVGAHGECKIRISQPWSLYTTLGKANITAQDIDDYAKLKMRELMTSCLSSVLQNYDYNNIMTKQSDIAAELAKRFSEELFRYGVEVESFALAGICFPEEYQQQRKAHFDAENDKRQQREQRREREREERREVESIVAIANATSNINVPSQPQAPAQNNVPPYGGPTNYGGAGVKYCPKCGQQVNATANFCPKCGQRL